MPDASAPTECSRDRSDGDGRCRAVERAALPARGWHWIGCARAAKCHVVSGRIDGGYDTRLFAGTLG